MRDLPDELRSELSVPYVAEAERVVVVAGGGYWPTLLMLQDGSLGAVVRGGSPHVGLNSRLDWVRSEDGGRTWSPPSLIVPASSDWDNRGSAAGQMADGTLVVGYWEATTYRGPKFDPQVGGLEPYYVISRDGGRTWSSKRSLHADPVCHGVALYGRIILLPDGTALMPLYGRLESASKTTCSAFVRSRDNGHTWGDCSVIAEGLNETCILRLNDGRLLAFMRHDTRGDTWQCVSTDNGYGWSEPERLTKPHQHPPDACLLQSGNVLLTYGNRIGDLAVGAMLSGDSGESWDWDERVVLARHSLVLRGKTWGDCGYPSTVQLADGTIVTVYYRLGSDQLPDDEQELCRQYERDVYDNPPASEDMRRFEEAICIRYTEEQLRQAAGRGIPGEAPGVA